MPEKVQTFGDLLTQARLAARVRQEEMARLLEISIPYYCQVERGRRAPFLERQVIRICQRLPEASPARLMAAMHRERNAPETARLLEILGDFDPQAGR